MEKNARSEMSRDAAYTRHLIADRGDGRPRLDTNCDSNCGQRISNDLVVHNHKMAANAIQSTC